MTKRMIFCRECKKRKEHAAFGLCSDCYNNKEYIICENCGQLKHSSFFVICENCHNNLDELTGDIKTTMYENNLCSLNLGVVFCETILIDYFKNSKAMTNRNTGFDFILDDGSKIDAKCSSLHEGGKNWYWTFNIGKNQIADYFCCVGIDNYEDREIMKVWLLPSNFLSKKGYEIKNITGLQIRENDKHFDEYLINKLMD